MSTSHALNSTSTSSPIIGQECCYSFPIFLPISSVRVASEASVLRAIKSTRDLPVVTYRNRSWICQGNEFIGKDIWNRSWYPKAADNPEHERKWYIVDATDKILGRMASTIAVHIIGKHLATFTPSANMGSFVIVVNAEKVAVSGDKRTNKCYSRHSGRPGGLKVERFCNLQRRLPERIIELAVWGMLPKGRLGRRIFHRLKVYKGPKHPHQSQNPMELPITDKRIYLEDKD